VGRQNEISAPLSPCTLVVSYAISDGRKNLVLRRNCCLAVAYLSANVYTIVKLRVFELARSRRRLLVYGVPFIIVGLSHPVGMHAHGDHAPI
jgi:hypothetical protein